MPKVDAVRLYEDALREGISVVPGSVFTTGDKYRNCLRLSAAFWSEAIEEALETVGGLAMGASEGAR
jgi:DNA-binding transcriptional MocR family regulator